MIAPFLAARPESRYSDQNETQFRRTLELYLRTLASAALGPTIRVTTADQALIGSTLADVTGQGVQVAPNTSYLFECFTLYQSATASVGIQVAVTCPAGAIDFAYNVSVPNLADSGGGDIQGQGTFSGDAVVDLNTVLTNTTFLARTQGVLRNGANAGSIQLQAANETATNNVTVKAGSVIRVTPL